MGGKTIFRKSLLAVAGLALTFGISLPATSVEAACDIDRPIVFADLEWDSALFHNRVAQFILEKGYGCKTSTIPGGTVPMLDAMANGKVDIMMEMWIPNAKEAWEKASAAGRVQSAGVNFPDAVQGIWVPRYMIEGDPKRGIAPMTPDLKSVEDLKKYAKLFRDPEEPSKGRLHNCVLGWGCEEVNSKKYEVYKLGETFTNFKPGTGAALAGSLASAYKRGRPWVGFYWSPTWVLGKYDMVLLEEPEYSDACWEKLNKDKPEDACAWPIVQVDIGVNSAFAKESPQTMALLEKYETTTAMISVALSYMRGKKNREPEDAAMNFLRTRPEIWTKWVDTEVAEKVKAALN